MSSAASRSVGQARLRFTTGGELFEAARACEAEVFGEHFGNSRAQLDDEYGPYLEQTGFVTVSRADGEVVGAARLILPGPAGVKTLDDVTGEPWFADSGEVAHRAGLALDRTIDVATLGVRRGAAFPGAAAAVIHGIITSWWANDIAAMVAVIDRRAHALLNTLGLYYQVLPGTWSAPYLGSVSSTPLYALVAEQIENQRRLAPERYRSITVGEGLGNVDVPAAETFRFRPGEVAA